jgi:GTPase SAR1 family protein
MQQANEIKVGLIGYPKTGKTKFIEKLLYGDSSVNKPYKPTLGVDVKPYDITYMNVKYRINLWDCAGNPRYIGLGKDYIQDAEHVFIFKDETHDNTVYEGWLSENTNFSYVDMNVENPIANIISDIKNKIIKPYSEL